MVYCYGNGVTKDENKNFVKAYFDDKAVDTFTGLPKKEDLRCKAMKESIFLNTWDFPGPNYEIRPTLARGSIHSAINHRPEEDRYPKVALFETNNLAEFREFQYKNFDYYPHSHPNFLEIMLITHKKATYWVGTGTENGQVDTSDPTFGDEDAEVKSARMGDGVRVEPGYLIYMPPGVPHSMLDTENGNIWFATCNPADVFTMIMSGYANDIYLPEEEKE